MPARRKGARALATLSVGGSFVFCEHVSQVDVEVAAPGLCADINVAVDAGGAIRAPGRCDIYMGIGEEAGHLAGQTSQEGHLYYLFLKP